jgi:hypothetical protein
MGTVQLRSDALKNFEPMAFQKVNVRGVQVFCEFGFGNRVVSTTPSRNNGDSISNGFAKKIPYNSPYAEGYPWNWIYYCLMESSGTVDCDR